MNVKGGVIIIGSLLWDNSDRMIKQNYRVYFNENIANNITTFQDDEIKAFFTPKA